jgi:uncharacterized membrane protein YgdD (TMEM256/DUF423 family)
MHERFPLLSAGVLGSVAVLAGAFAAHMVKPLLVDHHMWSVWQTAVNFNFFHALALLAMAAWMRPAPTGAAAHRAAQAVRFWTYGTLVFSGSLYVYALGGPGLHFMVWLTPLGGLGLLAGWIYAAGTALAPRSEYDI